MTKLLVERENNQNAIKTAGTSFTNNQGDCSSIILDSDALSKLDLRERNNSKDNTNLNVGELANSDNESEGIDFFKSKFK